MGLTCESCSRGVLKKKFNLRCGEKFVIALAGNPNVGKSTVFNELTGLKQHTGNWPGKTVVNARGNYRYEDMEFVLMDLPGTYSLLASSVEEQVARDFICFGQPDVTIVVVDGTCLERNLNLVLQVMELTHNVVVCVNLIDEAERKGIFIDIKALEEELGVPVVGTIAREGVGLEELKRRVLNVALNIENLNPKKISYSKPVEDAIKGIEPEIDRILKGKLNSRWVALRLIDGDNTIVNSIYEHIYDKKTLEIEGEEVLVNA
ncbi:MAG: 50S ribosome-binding GTPase [Clostridia bacterium]|nr:50S ribosome-binding GTPase [Clostridia bacterium]